MRRRPLRPGTAALILCGIYLFGLALGIGVICYLPSEGKRPGMLYSADAALESYTAGDPYRSASSLSSPAVIVYDQDGQLRDFIRHGNWPIDHDFVEQGKKLLPQIQKGKDTLKLVLFARDGSSLGYTSLLYVGVPMYTNGELTGAFVWVRELKDLLETILAFLFVFTLVFAAAALFMLLSLHNQRSYEQLRRQYIDNITHELKTPVASIKALAEALSDDMEKNANDRNVCYGIILRETNRQERMIRDVLELSKLQSNRMDLTKARVGAAEILAPVLEKYSVLCDCAGISLHVSEEISRLPPLYTNAAGVRQLLEILLDNALKFVPEGGNIWIEADAAKKLVTFCVRDDGSGIAKDALPHIFERFYKCSHDFNESGSGLGLAIAQEIAAGLKEKLWAESEPGKGAAFFFTVRVK